MEKKRIILLLSTILPSMVFAQDVIVKKDGSTIISKVLEINTADIKYKKFSNPNGPTYSLSIREITRINYENGENDIFENASNTIEENQNSLSQQMIEKQPADNNNELIKKHNAEVIFTSKTTNNKDAKWAFPIMGVSDSSLMSTDEIEMSFTPAILYDKSTDSYNELKHHIELKNKTNRIIYIDLANTFKIYKDNSYETYYDTKQISINNGSSSGIGVGLGGISNILGVNGTLGTLMNSVTVGGSSQGSITKTYSKERILAIPPHATAHLTEYEQVRVKKYYETISDIENWIIWPTKYKLYRGLVKKNQSIAYDEKNTPYFNQYIITYSTSQDFSTYATLNAKVYVRYIYGDFYSVLYSASQEKAIKRIQEFVTNFGTEPHLLIGDPFSLDKK